MLPERDIYEHDYSTKHYPKVSNIQFYHDMMKNEGLLNYYVFKDEFLKSHIELQKYRDYGLITSVFLSIALVYFYDRLPLLSRVKGKWSKFGIKTLIFTIPYTAIYIITDELKNKYMWEQYLKNFQRYICYKQTGDIQFFNAKIEQYNEQK